MHLMAGPGKGSIVGSMNPSNGEGERVRRHTAPEVNAEIDDTIRACVRRYALASDQELTKRIEELDHEFDIERTLQANASVVALTGIGMAAYSENRKWLILPTTVLGFLLLHATQGWCPPVPLFRRMGVRTRSEIERERFVLKFLRGDFDHINATSARYSPDPLLAAVEK
jgi:hypothetical protein